MRSLALICAAVAVSLALAGCNPPQVVQGTVVTFDEAAQVDGEVTDMYVKRKQLEVV